MTTNDVAAGPTVDTNGVTFALRDVGHVWQGVRLWQEVRIPGDELDFHRTGETWRLALGRPPVDRMEYLFEVLRHDGGHEMILDPGNELRVGGAFGDHSVVEFPDYVAPRWVGSAPRLGQRQPLVVASAHLDHEVHAELWSPDGLPDAAPAPLLVAHDGPEYDALAALTSFLAGMAAQGETPQVRALLLAPGWRDEDYSANPEHAAALVDEVLPAVGGRVAVTWRVGMGASLGGLAALHAHRLRPNTFAGLFLQSASFFHPVHDAHESTRFSRFPRITRFVTDLTEATSDPAPVPTVVTCGGIEENVENNRLLTATLARLGYEVTKREVRDMHNYTAWRDAFHPHLSGLLRRLAAG